MQRSSSLRGAIAALAIFGLVGAARADQPVYSHSSGGYSVTVNKAPGGGITSTQKWSSGAGPLNGKTIVSHIGGRSGSSSFASHQQIGSGGRVERSWGQQSTTRYSPSPGGTRYTTRTTGRDYSGRDLSRVSQGSIRGVFIPGGRR
jgi:hypothetical protein